MKESIGGFSLFNIVIVFVLLFTGYVSISINYSKAYNIKNEIINIIKNQNGICTSESSGNLCYNFYVQVQEYFKEANYRNKGNCNNDWVGYSRDGKYLGPNAKDAAFCVNAVSTGSGLEFNSAMYYQVEIFYQLDLPIFNQLFRFSVKGETAKIYSPNECLYEQENYPWC